MLTPLNLSVVVPLFNEEESLPHLVKQLLTALRPTGESFEIVLVNDGSSDGTAAVLIGQITVAEGEGIYGVLNVAIRNSLTTIDQLPYHANIPHGLAAPIPAAGALALLGIAALTGPRRRRG